MSLARALKQNPRELAGRLVERLQAQPAVQRWVEAVEIAGPGFVNLRLKDAARQAVVTEVLAAGSGYGQQPASGRKVLVEFVSANPTGPLHVGHARQAALGDAVCSLLATQGHEVTREFYYNDAGVQIATLANSVQARLQGLKPGDAAWPESAYNGDYIQDIAEAFLRRETVKADDRAFTASGDANDLDGIRQFAVAYLRHEQDLDLQAFGLKFDQYFLESSVYAGGQVEAAIARMAAHSYELDGALWLRTTDWGRRQGPRDEEARRLADLLRARRGLPHQQVRARLPPVHQHPGQRPPRHRSPACAPACRPSSSAFPKGYPDYVLHKMVTVMRGGQEVKISKRAGSYVTLRDLIDWTSRDAVRFFLNQPQGRHRVRVRRRPGAAAERREPGLLRAVRPCAHLLGAPPMGRQDTGGSRWMSADAESLDRAHREALMAKLAEYPKMLTQAAARTSRRTMSPSSCATSAAPSTATTRPSASWSMTRRSAPRAWPCWRPRQQVLAQRAGRAGRCCAPTR